jgi:anti-anti-sigma factor
MQCLVTTTDDHVNISLIGRLIFSDTPAFSPILKQVRDFAKSGCDVDLKGLEYLDSSGLRMLLLLYDVCQDLGSGLVFRTSPGQVHTMLMHSRFDTIVTIEG